MPAESFHEDIVRYITSHHTLYEFLQSVADAPDHQVLELTQRFKDQASEKQKARSETAIRMHFRCNKCTRSSSIMCMPCQDEFCTRCFNRDKCAYCGAVVEKIYTIQMTG